jgi:hypothetical protein
MHHIVRTGTSQISCLPHTYETIFNGNTLWYKKIYLELVLDFRVIFYFDKD